MSDEKKPQRRSAGWYSGTDRNTFIHRSWMKNQGHPDHMFDGRPIIGICNTFSDLTPCNGHFRELAEHVKRGVLMAGGVVQVAVSRVLDARLSRPSALAGELAFGLLRGLGLDPARAKAVATRAAADVFERS